MDIFGPTQVTLSQAEAWAARRGAHPRFRAIFPLYFRHGARYGIPAENAIGQSSHETNDWKYTGAVPASYHNMAGIKTRTATGDRPEDHQQFPDDETGVIAHFQHLAGYGGKKANEFPDPLVDPRFHLITKHTTTIEGLGGAWAPSPTYGQRVATRINELKATDIPMVAQIPGFTWVAADGRHHTTGRTQRIRGGAQHYTAGTNSLAWLSTSPNSDVSSTFLIKHEPTLEERGWQMVRIEDTPHTTGAAVNPFSVSIEYEHDGRQAIPDIAYTVLAQTWLDAAEYVQQHGLGEIPITRDGIQGHREWTGGGTICPADLDVDRIVREAQAILNPTPGPEPSLPMPVTRPDPWRENNPYSKDLWLPNAFIAWIEQHGGFLTVGYAMRPMGAAGDVFYQYFERARLELHPDNTVIGGLVGAELLALREAAG